MREKYPKALWHAGVLATLLGAMSACGEEETGLDPRGPDAPGSDASAGDGDDDDDDAPADAGLADASDPDPSDLPDAGDLDASDATDEGDLDASDEGDLDASDAADASDEGDADAAPEPEPDPDPVCGDGLVTHAETCDDGNTGDNDGCSSQCAVEVGWTCAGVPSSCTNVDECADHPCQNGGTCTDGIASFSCACAANYQGAQCETCPTNYRDCNGQTADGCEAFVPSDKNHCGGCGLVCGGAQICSQGQCKAVEPPKPETPSSAAAMYKPMAPAIADLDNDGKLDVLVANADSGSSSTPSGSLSFFKGNGDGTLRAEARFAGAALSSNAVVAVDVNGDGWLDAVTVDGQTNLPTVNGSISVYLNTGNPPGSFASATSYTTGAPGSLHLCAGDFNGDGHSDIATTSVTSNQVSVLLGAGNGNFSAPVLIAIADTGGVQSSILCHDLNGDSLPDIAVTSPYSARVSVLLNQGSGSFGAPVAYTNSQNGQTAGLALGDADGDGKLDLLSNGAAGLYTFWFKGNGNGTFATGLGTSTGYSAVSNSALGVVASDFNGDGKLDLYVLRTTTSGSVLPMAGAGNGAFSAGTAMAIGTSPALNAIAAGDMDGNGYADLVATNKGSNSVMVLLNAL